MTLEQSHSGLLLAKRYQLGDVMGTGAISTIYRGQDTVLQRAIVIKAVPPEHVAAYRRALQVSSELTHPAIVATYDALLHDHWLFLMQEAVSARSLDIYLGSGIPAERSLDLASQIARALAYAHSHRVIHGDLTPAAILVDRQARAHINNFALPTNTEYFIDVAHTLPSDHEDSHEIDLFTAPPTPAGDIRAVGLLLWQLLSTPGAKPSNQGSQERVFRQDVPDPVRGLVWRCVGRRHPRAIKDVESLALALEMEARALTSARAPLSELTPPALRAAREAVAQMASWSTEDTLGALQPWRTPSHVWQPRQAPGDVVGASGTGQRTKIATEEPIGQPRLRLPSRTYDASVSSLQLEQQATQPEIPSAEPVSYLDKIKLQGTGIGPRTLLVLGITCFLLAFLIGFFLMAMLGGH